MTRKEFLAMSGKALAAAGACGLTGGATTPPRALRFESKPVDLHLKHAWTIARNSSTTKRNVLARISCEGLEGFGEAAPNVRYDEDWETVTTALNLLRPHLGDDPGRLEAILDRLDEILPGNHAAKAAIDIALHDWVGRKERVPLYRKFGVDPKKTPLTSYSIGIDTIPAMQEKVKEAADFKILKIKVGLKDDRAILEGIRAVTDKPLYVDANEGWKDVNQAVAMIRIMQDLGVVLLEQPLPARDLDGAKAIRDRVDLPIIADEACLTVDDIPKLAEAYDGINIKLQKSGGLRMARLMIEAARARRMRVMIGCMIETSVGITAAAHLSPLVDHADLDGNLLIVDDPFRGVIVREGRLVLPDRPGLGVEGRW